MLQEATAAGGSSERKRSAMRRRGLWIGTETRPAHSLQQKLGIWLLKICNPCHNNSAQDKKNNPELDEHGHQREDHPAQSEHWLPGRTPNHRPANDQRKNGDEFAGYRFGGI